MRVPTLELTANISTTRDPTIAADTNYDVSGSGESDGPREPTEIEALRCCEINPNWDGTSGDRKKSANKELQRYTKTVRL